jgi:hypothetical protein
MVKCRWIEDVQKEWDRLGRVAQESLAKGVFGASAEGNNDALRCFIKYFGAEAVVKARGEMCNEDRVLDGLTALHVACCKGNADSVSLLLQSGAEVNAIDEYQDTPLQMAARRCHSAIFKLLIQSGA